MPVLVVTNPAGAHTLAQQMTALTLLLAASGGGGDAGVQVAGLVGPPLLCAAAALSVGSLAAYTRALWKHL